MARLTRKFLTALGIEDENVQDQIVSAHTETTDALKAQRDEYKVAFDELPKVKGDLEKAQADLETLKAGGDPYKQQYEDIKAEYDNYKIEVENNRVKALKKSAYRKLLKDIKISEDTIDSIIGVTNFDEIELDGENIKNADTVKETAKTKWKGFVVTTSTRGANTETPPENNGGKTKTLEEIKKIPNAIERQQAYKDYFNNERNT